MGINETEKMQRTNFIKNIEKTLAKFRYVYCTILNYDNICRSTDLLIEKLIL